MKPRLFTKEEVLEIIGENEELFDFPNFSQEILDRNVLKKQQRARLSQLLGEDEK